MNESRYGRANPAPVEELATLTLREWEDLVSGDGLLPDEDGEKGEERHGTAG